MPYAEYAQHYADYVLYHIYTSNLHRFLTWIMILINMYIDIIRWLRCSYKNMSMPALDEGYVHCTIYSGAMYFIHIFCYC